METTQAPPPSLCPVTGLTLDFSRPTSHSHSYKFPSGCRARIETCPCPCLFSLRVPYRFQENQGLVEETGERVLEVCGRGGKRNPSP